MLLRRRWVRTDQPGLELTQAWRWTTFALVLVGFLALAWTGEIHWAVRLIFIGGWVTGLLISHSAQWWRPWMTQLTMWVPLSVIALIVLQGRFESLLYLLMFLGLFKCLTLQGPGDHMQAMLMAFFMLLACTVITTSAGYLIFLLIFIALAMLDLALMSMAREQARQTEAVLPRARAHIGPRIWFTSFGTALATMLFGYGLFLVMPHYSLADRYQSNPFGAIAPEAEEDVLSGYSDDLTLRNIGNIGLDQRLVMKVTSEWRGGNLAPPTMIRLRGTVLDHYDGTRWDNHPRVGNDKVSDIWERIDFAREEGVLQWQWIEQDVSQIERLFASPMPVRFDRLPGGFSMHLSWVGLRTMKLTRYPQLPTSAGNWINYLAVSALQPEATTLLEGLSQEGRRAPADEQLWLNEELVAASLRGPAGRPSPMLQMTAEERRLNTQLPSEQVSEMIHELARVRMTASSTPDQILQLLAWFRDDFTYTLQPRTGFGRHPLESFLMHTRRGHCEYFASSFALLLRARNIPARVALGFLSTEFELPEQEDSEGSGVRFNIRQSDAHAWTEVWLDGYGWLTVDPTPPGYRGRGAMDEQEAGGLRWMMVAARILWQQYVLDYSSVRQGEIFGNVTELLLVRTLARSWGWIERHLDLESGRGFLAPNRRGSGWERHLWLLAPPVALLMLGGGGWWLGRRLWRWPGRRRRADRHASPLDFVNRLLAQLERKGWRRRSGQTVGEFLLEIEDRTTGQLELAPLVELYQRRRFAGEPAAADDERLINETLRRLANSHARDIEPSSPPFS